MLKDERTHFGSVPADAELVRAKNGETPPDTALSGVEVAATTMLTRALLGFDDCVMKP